MGSDLGRKKVKRTARSRDAALRCWEGRVVVSVRVWGRDKEEAMWAAEQAVVALGPGPEDEQTAGMLDWHPVRTSFVRVPEEDWRPDIPEVAPPPPMTTGQVVDPGFDRAMREARREMAKATLNPKMHPGRTEGMHRDR